MSSGVHVHVYGHMPEKCQKVYLTIQNDYPQHLHLHGYVDSRTTCGIVAKYHWGLIYSHAEKQWPMLETTRWHFNRLNSPGKMAQYIAAGVPYFVKRGIYDFMERVAIENGFGFVFEDYDDLIQKLKNEAGWQYYRECLKLYKYRFSMEAQADKMLQFFRKNLKL